MCCLQRRTNCDCTALAYSGPAATSVASKRLALQCLHGRSRETCGKLAQWPCGKQQGVAGAASALVVQAVLRREESRVKTTWQASGNTWLEGRMELGGPRVKGPGANARWFHRATGLGGSQGKDCYAAGPGCPAGWPTRKLQQDKPLQAWHGQLRC